MTSIGLNIEVCVKYLQLKQCDRIHILPHQTSVMAIFKGKKPIEGTRVHLYDWYFLIAEGLKFSNQLSNIAFTQLYIKTIKSKCALENE